MPKVLIVDDEENIRVMLRALLTQHKYEVLVAQNASQALEIMQKNLPDFIITDVRMPGMSGIDFVKICREKQIPSTIIVMSAYGNVDSAIEAMKAGAYDYIMKPFKADELILVLRKAQEREELRKENLSLKEEIYQEHAFEGMLSKSRKMQTIFLQIDKIAPYKTTVLITGESGTGKELVARALHRRSPRSGGPIVAINCGAIPEYLLESELFGHKKGAFTDATTDKKGLFEVADDGTLFLDEIGEMPLSLQVKLLRVLEEDKIRRIGDTRDIDVDVRIVAATTRNLGKLIEEGKFREELYFRLNVVSIQLPPMRERPEDIPILIEHFIKRNNNRFDLKRTGMDPEAMKTLSDYDWPGNIRELVNAVERACLMAESGIIRKSDLPDSIIRNVDPLKKHIESDEISIKKTMKYAESVLIKRALEITAGNKTQAAKLLEISHRALLYKIKEYKIEE
ncbi:MAG: sigma-54 dependent transcriptional regulator [Pseudomonadota bacterium]